MKKINSLKAAFGWMLIAFVGMFMSVSIVSCDKDDLTGHDNSGNAVMSISVKPDTTKPAPTPTPVYRDSSWVKVSHDTITIVVEHFKNDTLINADSVKCNFGVSIKRVEDKLQTTEDRLANLDFSFGETANSRNGKMQFVGKQQITDADGQTYNGELLSGYCTLGSLKDVHAELVSFRKSDLQNEALEPGKDEAKLVNTNIAWNYVVSIVNAPNLEGKTFELTTNSTEHLRFIPKNAPELLKTDTTMVRRPDVWFTNWDLIIEETWSNDSVAEKKKTVRTSASVEPITLEDKFVSSFDYSYTNNDLSWGTWKAIQSNDSSISLEEQEGSKLGNASNGYSNDAFDTKYVAKRQRATVLFGGFKWNIPAEEVTLSTTRKVFVEQTSDLDGYSMVKFTNDEIARYNNANDKTLTESCKLYLKLAEPEVEKFLFDQEVKHTTDKVTVTTTGTPVYDNGAKGKSIDFVMEEPETFKCLDEFAFEKVAEVSETTGAMEKDGEVVKTKQTKNVKSGEYTGTYTYYKYEQKYRQPITCNGETKYQHWLATWYDDFSFVVKSFENKNYAKVGSYSAIVEKDASHLTKSTSLSTEDLEVWLYSINGTFKLDNVERKDIGNGRITQVVIGENYWDESTKGREITALEVKSWCEFIRFKSDGTKTSQKYTHVFNRVSGASTWEVSAEKAEEVNGNIIPLAPVDNNRTDDFCHFTARLYEYDITVDIQGAAQQKDFAKFTEAEEMYFEVEGKKVYFENPTHSISNTVRNLTVKSENDSETVYQHENVWSWNYGGVVTEVTSTGLIDVAKSSPVNPDFDIEVGSIYATVSRPSNRDASDITAYTYLLVSKDGTKCLPLGFYNGVVTEGSIEEYKNGMNSACYVKDENRVVATTATLKNGIIKYTAGNGSIIDGGTFLQWQGAGFNDRGNDYSNHTGKYAPRATKKGNVTVVTFEGTNVSYSFKGWDVQ